MSVRLRLRLFLVVQSEFHEFNILRLFEVAEKEVDEGGELEGVVLLLDEGKRFLQLGQLLLHQLLPSCLSNQKLKTSYFRYSLLGMSFQIYIY